MCPSRIMWRHLAFPVRRRTQCQLCLIACREATATMVPSGAGGVCVERRVRIVSMDTDGSRSGRHHVVVMGDGERRWELLLAGAPSTWSRTVEGVLGIVGSGRPRPAA